jgi:potassium/sodium efflux P-type ATPase
MGRLSGENNIEKLEKVIHKLSLNEVYEALNTGSLGLTQTEAEIRLHKYGTNTIQEVKGKPLILKFLANFTHLMAILLWVGGIVGFIAEMPELGIAIWMVNVINGIFSFWQEYRAEEATKALKKMLPEYAHVLRDGEEKRILAEELVIGDIILLSEGDKISADGRLIEESDLKTNQSTLTGESRPVRKTKEIVLKEDLTHAEEPNLIFAGTNVAAGAGKAVIFATGMDSEFGKIARLTQETKEELSPLQREMKRVTKMVSIMAVSIGIFFFITAIVVAKVQIAESFIFGMGMIVAFVPEGLLPTVTLSLAMGVQRMAKRNALIKNMSAVETLGCTSVICTDKTGTLTQNEMTVSNLWMVREELNVTGVGYSPEGQILKGEEPILKELNINLHELLIAASFCNDAKLVKPNEETPHWSVLGDPTEGSLIVAAKKAGIDIEAELSKSPRIKELTFESNRKRMSTIHKFYENTSEEINIAYIKGAPKEVLNLCTKYYENGKHVVMSEAIREQIIKVNDNYAREGLRVLAIAMRVLPKEEPFANLNECTVELVEKDLTFLGLIAMSDPPRIGVAEAVEKCHNAGIRIIMITGDYGLTAESIARHIGVVRGEHPHIITGIELEKMSKEELKGRLEEEVIFARVAPEQKLRVVSALQEMGHVVAVTGDGVNDSPALKKADIGVAMGVTGTDVAKEAADMILTDDNFASIVNAVEEGRAVFNNIRKFALYILNSNVSEAVPFVVFLLSRGTIPLPLTIMQVLSIDLGTDMVPALALGAELPEEGIMDSPPRSQKEPLLGHKLIVRALFWYGMIGSVAAMSAFFFLNYQYGWPEMAMASSGTIYRMATTMTLAAIVATQVGIVFNCRTERISVFKVGLFSNRLVLLGIAFEITLLCILIYVPFLNGIFNTAPIGFREWAFLLIWPLVVVLLDEVRKAILRRNYNRMKGKKTIE